MKYPVIKLAPATRWLIALAWTLLVVVSLLMPGKVSVIRELSFADFLVSFFTYKLTIWDVVEVNFHIILFVVLTAVWFWVFDIFYGKRKALLIAIGIALVLGLTTEITQYFVGRGSRLFDLLANYLGIVLFIIWQRQRICFKTSELH